MVYGIFVLVGQTVLSFFFFFLIYLSFILIY